MIDPALLQNASPDRIARLLGHGVSEALVGRLCGTPRLRARLATIIAAQLGDIDALNDRQTAVLAMRTDAATELSMRAGAVWHAVAIARVIDGPSRRALVAALGEDRYRLALEGLALAAPAEVPDRSPEAIAAAVPADGAVCFVAWCDVQPPAVAGRLALLRPAASVTPAHTASGPAIVDWLLRR